MLYQLSYASPETPIRNADAHLRARHAQDSNYHGGEDIATEATVSVGQFPDGS